MKTFGLTDNGCVRAENQDRILVDLDLGLFMVADGMGGHRHGEMAAELAISTMKYYMESSRDRTDVTWPFGYNFNLSMDENRLVTGIRLANRQVWRRAEEAPECAGMGTTIAAVLVNEDRAVVANVGDSRVYLFRNGDLKQLTIDDTWLSAVLERGVLDQKELLTHPMRNVLTQAAGSQTEVDVHVLELAIELGDTLMISSDGLHGVVPHGEMQSTLAVDAPIEKLANRLLEAARSEGAPDNVSCILLSWKD